MKSRIDGCVRLCDDCPLQPETAVAYNAGVRHNILDDPDYVPLNVDPRDIEGFYITNVMDFRDYGNKDAEPIMAYSTPKRKGTVLGRPSVFPVTITSDMIEACVSPITEKSGLFRRRVHKCGAYVAAMGKIPEGVRDAYEAALASENTSRR